MEPLRIDVWSDVACPWCLLGTAHLRQALAKTGVAADVRMRSYQLNPTMAGAVPVREYLAQRYGSPEHIDQAHARLRSMGAAAGITYDFDNAVAANTFDAHRLHHLGQRQGKGDAVMQGLLRAQHTQGLDVSSYDVLRRVGIEAGLAPEEVDSLLAGDAFGTEVEADIEQGAAIGVRGVPFFVFGGRLGLSGAQPVAVFEQALRQAIATAPSS